MLKRILLDIERHKCFFAALSQFLPELKNSGDKSRSQKRQRVGDDGISQAVFQGDAGWRWGDPHCVYLGVEFYIIGNQGIVTSRYYKYATFCEALRRVLTDLSWLQQITQGPNNSEWHLQIPSFLYNVFATSRASFCIATKTDNLMTEVFSVGRYIRLAKWMKKNEMDSTGFDSDRVRRIAGLPKHLSCLHPVVQRGIMWLALSKRVPQKDIRMYLAMLENSLEHASWWDLSTGIADTSKTRILIEELVSIVNEETNQDVKLWINFFEDLPIVLERFHGRARLSKKSKSRVAETTVKSLTFSQGLDILSEDGMWGDVMRVKGCAKGVECNTSGLLFTEPNITTDQVAQTLRLLFEEWADYWAIPIGVTDIEGHYKILRTSKGVLLFVPTNWVTEIQERLMILLSLHPGFRKRYSVPVAPWLTEKFFSGNQRDKELVMRTFYRLIHMHTHERCVPLLAAPEEDEYFWVGHFFFSSEPQVYEHLHEILNHFEDPVQIFTEYKNVFEDVENLYFSRPKKSNAEERLMGIKNVACLHRALKSVLEIKAPHFISPEGIEILDRNGKLGIDNLPDRAGDLTAEQTIAIYRLCATNTLNNMDALGLFYHTYVDGEILFSAKLHGVENWTRVAPFLRQYNNKVLKKLETDNTTRGSATKTPCIALFHCFKIAEEMAYYPFHVTRKSYEAGDPNFRGNLTQSVMICDPRDFVVGENKCPIMLHAENTKENPRTWFSGDIFPMYEGTICHSLLNTLPNAFANYAKSNAWRDLRPFEDAHPYLLEYLTAEC